MPLPDIVYIVSANEINDELKHSLRSLANLPHGRVWLVGYKPRWVTGVEYLPQMQRGDKHDNTWNNWLAAARCPDISGQFVLFNDDFYVTRPIGYVEPLYRSTLAEAAVHYRAWGSRFYEQRAVRTSRLLAQVGITEALSYELHVPMMIHRLALLEAMEWVQGHPGWRSGGVAKRTLYGNWAAAGGEQAHDVKVQTADAGLPDTPLPYLSTSPQSWRGLVGQRLRQQFAEPCEYEISRQAVRMYRPPTRGAARAGR